MAQDGRPNIIFIMVDDLGYGDLGSYGQRVIKTPHLDALAESGIKFTNFYSGSPVCAPARSVLMTGLHTGHTTVRGNFGIGGVRGLGGGEGRVPLREDDITIAEVLKSAGYHTGITGKWGLGEPSTTGLPNDQGFDEWFGFLNQRRAHHHFTDYIWKDKEKYSIPSADKFAAENYTQSLFTKFALDFIDRNAPNEKPFFLYIPYLLPHDEYEIPRINPLYEDKIWTLDEKVHASMVSMIDEDVSQIIAKLKDAGIEKETILFFTSDNGAAQRWDGRFDSSGSLRGRKRDVYEGGIRVPMIVVQPGTIVPGQVNHTPWSFADMLPTMADIGAAVPPQNLDGISMKDVIHDPFKPGQNDRSFYWEFHEQGGKQAVRLGKWKGVRLDVHEKGFHDELELYNLDDDPAEQKNIASKNPAVVSKLIDIMNNEHKYSDSFPFSTEVK